MKKKVKVCKAGKDVSLQNIDLFCEYLKNPLGIQSKTPRFSWKLKGNAYIGEQIKYRIIVSASRKNIADDIGDCWDSGITDISRSTGVTYEGCPLKSKTMYFWKVTMWCKGLDTPISSKICTFETALLSRDDWKCDWLQSPNPVYGVSPVFREEFQVNGRVRSARIYISGLGYYCLYINGKRIGDRCLEPGWTDYRKRVLYSVYDVGRHLDKGKNVIGVELGEGWYGHRHESFMKFLGHQPLWNGIPKFRLQVEITTYDGHKTDVVSSENGSWLCSDGPIRENGIYDGELYDARLEKRNWSSADYSTDPGEWSRPAKAEPPGGEMVAQYMPPIRVNRIIQQVRENKLSDGRVVYDMGQNFSGWVQVECIGEASGRIDISYGETLKEDGTVNQANLRGARACDTYILSGNGTELYEPRFTYHGFRYVEISCTGGVSIKKLTGKAVSTDVRRTGSFKCSSKILNRIYDAVIRTETNNMHSVPTDCPQRDERMAWLNDMTVRCEEALYNFDLLLFYEKWLDDIADAQDENTGAIPDTAPFVYVDNPSSHISSCYVLIPWMLYRFYGDITAASRLYDRMKRYIEFLASKTENGLIYESYYGDWAPPMQECLTGSGWDALPSNIPPQLITTGYLYYDCLVMQKIAKLTGHDRDIEYFDNLAKVSMEALNNKFLNVTGSFYGTNSQACNIFPLFLDIIPPKLQHGVLDNLLEDLVNKHSYHITTGNQMTKYLFEVLDKQNLNDIALKVASSETYPSLGYMLESGATTIWERWEYLDGSGMNSHNHPMNGAFTYWFFKALGGIRLPEDNPGFGRVEINPDIIDGLSFANSSYDSIKGKIVSQWKKRKNTIEIKVSIPWNMRALLTVPVNNCPDNFNLLCNNEAVIEKGRITQRSEGVSDIKIIDRRVHLNVNSGTYRLVIC